MNKFKKYFLLSLILFLIPSLFFASTYRRIEHPKFQAFDENGDPCSGCLLYTWEPGTSTPKATYNSSDSQNTNPVVLDSYGRAEIYGTGFYKLKLCTDPDGDSSCNTTLWTIDNIQGIAETSIIDIGDYSGDFDAAITAIGATPTTLYIDEAATMSSAVTVPSTCSVVLQKGGSIDMGGYALTFNGDLTILGGSFTHDATLTINGDFKTISKDLGWDTNYTIAIDKSSTDKVRPEWWGGKADDSTLSAAAINAAIDVVYAAGGGEPKLFSGTYLIDETVILKHNVVLGGVGIEKTILKANTNLNAPVVQSYNYETFLGQNKNTISDGVPHNIGLKNMTINGNKANQSSSEATGVELYAGNLVIEDLYIRDCYGDGWVSEKGVGTTPDGSTQLYEGRVDGLWLGYNGGRGMYFKGPNDTRFNQLITFENTGDGVEFADSAGVYSASHHIEHLHSYANGGYGVKTNRALRINDLEASNNGKAGLKITAGYYHTVDFANIYRNCETSGSFQVEVDSTTGYSHFNFLFKDNEQYRAGVGDLDFNAFNSYINVISIADDGSTGTGVRIGTNASKLVANLNIKGYNGTGGVGLETGYGGAVTNVRISATLIDNKTGWVRTNASNISNYDMNIQAEAGQTTWSGEAFVANSSETARIAAYDTDTTKNWTEVYGLILGGLGYSGAQTAIHQKTTEITSMSGATETWAAAIPAGTIVLGVTARVTTLVEGCTSMDIGENGGDTDLFIDGMDVALNTTADLSDANTAFTAPKLYATQTDILVTAVGGAASFTAGSLRLVLHYIDLDYPIS